MIQFFTTLLSGVKSFFTEDGKTSKSKLILTGVAVLAILVLILTNLNGCNGKKVNVADCPDFSIRELQFDSIKTVLENELAIQIKINEENPKGEVINEPGDKFVPKDIYLTSIERKEYYKRLYLDAIEKLGESVTELEDLQEDDFEDSGQWFTGVQEQLPTVLTIKQDSSKNHKLRVEIQSQGDLLNYSQDLKVIPSIVEIPVYSEPEKIKDKRKNVIAPGVGFIRYSGDINPAYSIMYSRGIFGVRFGAIANDEWKPKGINDVSAEALLIVKF
jgi:hypothetical protein